MNTDFIASLKRFYFELKNLLSYSRSEGSIIDEALIRLFFETYKLKMAISSCGYGAAVDCVYGDCILSPYNAIWNEGFFEWLEEEFFGCEE
jgi:hypothetical protein